MAFKRESISRSGGCVLQLIWNASAARVRVGSSVLTGTDLTQIDKLDVMAAVAVVSDVSWDMSKWQTKNQFVSWLKLSPENKIAGRKIIGKARMPAGNRATTVLS